MGNSGSWGGGCQISWQREACTIAQESPPAPSRGRLTPTRSHPVYLGRGEISTAPEKTFA